MADREAALRDLLQTVRDALDVPAPAHEADQPQAWHARDLRAQIVRVALKDLITGTLDNTAVQSTGRMLRELLATNLEIPYEVAR